MGTTIDPAALTVALVPVPPLAQLAPHWRALEAAADATAYQGWSWVGARLAGADPATRLIVAHAGAQLAGLAFVTPRWVRRRGLVPVRLLYLNDFGDQARDVACVEYNDVLALRGLEGPVRAAMLAGLDDPALGWWDGLFVRTATPEVLAAMAAATGLAPRTEALGPSAAIDLAAVRAAGGLGPLLSANTRQQVRRSMRLYEEAHGPLALETTREAGPARAWLEALTPLHQARWAMDGQPSAIGQPGYRTMLEQLIALGTACQPPEVELVRISAGDHCLGYLFNLLYRGEVLFYLGALAQAADPRLKPGLVAHWLCAEARAQEGFRRYDFLAGAQRYKTQLGVPGPAMASVLLCRPRARFRLEALLRGLKRRLQAGVTPAGPADADG